MSVPDSASIRRRLWSYIRPHLPLLGFAGLLMVGVAAARGGAVFLVEFVLDDVLIAKDRVALRLLPVALLAVFGLHSGCAFFRGMITKRVGLTVTRKMRGDLFAHFQRLSLDWLFRQKVGDLMTRVTNDSTGAHWAVAAAVTAVQRPLTLVALFGAAFYQEWKLTLVAVALLPVVYLLIHRFGRGVRKYTRKYLGALGEMSGALQENLSGMRVVQAFGGEDREVERFERLNGNQFRMQLRKVMYEIGGGPTVELATAAAVAVVLYLGGLQVLGGTSTPGSLVAFLISLSLMNEPLKGMAQLMALYQQAMGACERVFDVLDTEPAIQDEPGAEALDSRSCSVRFDGVGFSYDGETDVLRDVELSIPAGEVVAVVGESGAGKTTLANLLLRFADPTAGAVRIEDHDLRELTVASVRRHTAVVTQETFLFDDTVEANIRYAESGPTDEDVRAAARAASAHEFIEALPGGYDTRIGERGVRLSGGQRQRIAIARAILRDAPILILDEATSNLDSASEAEVQAALEQLMRGKTTLVVAHRLSTVRNADRIVVLRRGRIVEQGSHDDLLQRGGEYSRLLARQVGEV